MQKVALITGGSAGIGLAVARKLAASGTRVALVARTERTLREAADGLAGMAEIFPLDVKDLPAVAALPARIVAQMGGLAEVVTTNLTAPVVLCRAAAPVVRAGGAIVNVASLAGMLPVRFQATYGASKAGLRAFSRAIRQELRERGISVSVVSPGPVDTGFFGEDLERVPDLVFSQPMSTAEEIADAVLACIREGHEELAVPWLSGKLCTLGYLSPGLLGFLQPAMERRGARAKRAYIDRKRAR